MPVPNGLVNRVAHAVDVHWHRLLQGYSRVRLPLFFWLITFFVFPSIQRLITDERVAQIDIEPHVQSCVQYKSYRRPRLACADAPYSSAIEALAATDYWGHRLPDIQSSSRWTLSRKVLLTSSPRKFSCLTSVGFSRISALIPFAQPVHD